MADGKVVIDTSVDSKGAVNDINGMESKVKAPLKRIAALMAVAFSVKAIANFAKEAESLYETQLTQETKLATVMKQRMGASYKQIQQVKDLASEQQQLGVIGDEVQLAGAQQIATFLNEQKSLESLIPAMNNLIAQQYGYSATAESAKNIGNLFGKVMQGQTTALKRVGITFTEAEEKVLKYGNEQQRAAMLAQVITNNVGNMNSALANTPYGQQQQLSNTIGDIKENFGQAFVNIKALFLPALNVVAGIANKASLAFISLSKSLASTFGIDLSKNQALASGIQQQADGADALAVGMDDVADSTKKANKQAKAGVRAFDGLINIQTNKDSSSDSKSSNSAGTSTTKTTSTSNIDKSAGKAIDIIGGIKEKASELKGIIDNLFGSTKLTTSVQNLVASVITTLQKLGTSALSIGKSIGTNILNGIQNYFSNNKKYISDNLSTIFNNISGISLNIGSLAESLADILEELKGPEATQITESIIGIFVNSKLGIATLMSNIAKDFSTLLTKPIVDNTKKIKTAFNGILTFVAPIMKTLEDAVTNTWSKINETYETYVSPAFDAFTQAISDTLGAFLDMWNEYVSPVLAEIGAEVPQLWAEYVQPVIDSAIELIGKVAEMISAFWSNILLPLIQWIVSKVGPLISGALNGIWIVIKTVVKNISTRIKSIIDVFSSIVTFLTDIFKGDFDKVWKDIRGIIDSVINLIGKQITGFIDTIKGIASAIGTAFKGAWDSIVLAFGLDKVKEFFSGIWTGITDAFSNVTTWFKDKFSAAWQAVKDVFNPDKAKDAFNGIKDGILKGLKSIINLLIDGINAVMNVPFGALNKVLKKIKGLSIAGVEPFSWVKELTIPEIPKLATGAVLPPNKPFLATVGDQRHGTNIEAPLDTIVQAMNIALAKNGGNGGGDIVINIDGNEIFRVIQNKANEFTKRTGLEAFT